MIEFLFLRNKYDRILTYNIHFMIIALYYHSKIPIDFFLNKKEKKIPINLGTCRGSNLRYLIQ